MWKSLRNLLRPRITWDELLAEYLSSQQFRNLAHASQGAYRPVLERWLRDAEIGQQAVAHLTRQQLEASLGDLSQGAAHFRFKRARVLLRFAVSRGYRTDDPTLPIKCKPIGREHHTWTDEEIEQYRAHWRLGTRQRLAFELALCTSQRRTDLAALRWENISGGRIVVTQSKTGAALSLPIHPDLQAALDTVPKGRRKGPVIARKSRPAGGPLTPESLGNIIADWIEAAGLPKRCVLHGLRKACCRRLAEVGCSDKEIASISGHRTLGEIARYTRAASQERLSDAAFSRIAGGHARSATPGAGPALESD